ncbi:hypothetical protein KVU_1964 [Ketogulonicigenium vulgare WSH-001]|uniref:Uncharacterized protein n=1 Tax=Ketogulonicigenium vulgare (strain WSH-001) TaxID=759362 RepID=F9Y4R9_KETVW|nr:hypothetical protein KVU_1964 [Ketogulonicigenium vulgare WSH-001]
MRQADIDDLGARIFQHGDTVIPQLCNLGRQAVDAVFARDADGLAANIAGQGGFEIGHGQIGTCRILGVGAGHGGQHNRCVAHVLGHRARLIQRGSIGDNAPARDAAIGRLDAGDAGEGRRLADRAAGIRAGGGQTQIGRNRRSRATRRAAGRQRRIAARRAPRVHRRAIDRGFVGRAHGEFVHVQLAQHHRAITEQFAGDGRFVFRLEPRQNAGCRLACDAFGREQVFDAQRDAAHIGRIARFQARIGGICLRAGNVGRLVDIGVQRIRAFDRADIAVGQLAAGQFAFAQQVACGGDGQFTDIGHSTTFGTAKNPSRASGALARTAACCSPSVTMSSRRFRRMGVTEVIGSTPSTSTSFSCSMNPRIAENSEASAGRASGSTRIRASFATRRAVSMSIDMLFSNCD